MSHSAGAGGQPGDQLQFDQVEYATPSPAATCKLCSQPLQDTYYDINGQAVCPACRERCQQAVASGSGVGRFLRAVLYGSLAGLVGAALYYGVREVTHLEFGLISIVVGLFVGGAVKKGSGGRGGWFYQALAMFLTYTAIVVTYIPPVIQAIRQEAAKQEAGNAAGAVKPAGAPNAAGEPAAPGDAGGQPRPSIMNLLLALAQLLLASILLVGFAYAIPVIVGFQSPMGLIIIGVGLYEAWVINRRTPLVIHGPYRIGLAGTEGAVHVEPAG